MISKEITFDGNQLSESELPYPQGWQVLLAPIKISEKTSGGIIISSSDQKGLETVRFVSKVLAIGPLAYTGDKFKVHPEAKAEPWCSVGDIVTTGQYAGSQLPCLVKGESFYLRVVNDDEIKCVLSETSILDI